MHAPKEGVHNKLFCKEFQYPLHVGPENVVCGTIDLVFGFRDLDQLDGIRGDRVDEMREIILCVGRDEGIQACLEEQGRHLVDQVAAVEQIIFHLGRLEEPAVGAGAHLKERSLMADLVVIVKTHLAGGGTVFEQLLFRVRLLAWNVILVSQGAAERAGSHAGDTPGKRRGLRPDHRAGEDDLGKDVFFEMLPGHADSRGGDAAAHGMREHIDRQAGEESLPGAGHFDQILDVGLVVVDMHQGRVIHVARAAAVAGLIPGQHMVMRSDEIVDQLRVFVGGLREAVGDQNDSDRVVRLIDGAVDAPVIVTFDVNFFFPGSQIRPYDFRHLGGVIILGKHQVIDKIYHHYSPISARILRSL